jgi:hypothetical protein
MTEPTRKEVEQVKRAVEFLTLIKQPIFAESVKLAYQRLLDENERLKEKLDRAIYELGEPQPGSFSCALKVVEAAKEVATLGETHYSNPDLFPLEMKIIRKLKKALADLEGE